MDKATTKHWNDKAAQLLVGRTIKAARYMTEAEAEEYGWDMLPVVLMLDNGATIIPQSDDEGNNGGVLMVDGDVLPVL